MTKKSIAITRAVGIVGATTALITGFTFASLTASPVTLSNNTISTATAGLEVQVVDSNFATTQQGFTITNLIPGAPSAPFFFNLRTTGAVPLAITAHVPATPTYSGFVSGGFSGVHVKITQFDNSGIVYADTTLADLLAGDVSFTGAPLAGTSQIQLKAVVTVANASVTGSSASVNSFNIVLTGTAQ